MAENTDGVVYTRDFSDVVWANKLTLANGDLDSSTNYSADDFLHTNLLTFSNAFLNSGRGRSKVNNIIVKLHDTGLYKPDLRLLLFNRNECDIAPAKNTAFAETANTTLEHCILQWDILAANFKDQSKYSSGTVTQDSVAVITCGVTISNEVIDSSKAKHLDVVGMLLPRGGSVAGKYATGAWVKVGLDLTQQ